MAIRATGAAFIFGLAAAAAATHWLLAGPPPTRPVVPPLSFIENQGQLDREVAFHVSAPRSAVHFTSTGYTLRLPGGHTVNVALVGAEPRAPASLKRAPGVVSYFKGPKEQWRTGIATHARIGYAGPWPGIDLAYNGDDGRLESVYTVAPGADPSAIRLRYSGQQRLALDSQGNLIYSTPAGVVTESAPVLYQDIDGVRIPVEGRYRLLGENTVGFEVARYESGHPLVIDPSLAYAGFIGGSGDDQGYALAVDSAGNVYITGHAASTATTFPDAGGPDLSHNGDYDAFVVKINAAGTAILYAGYIGGSGEDRGTGIAVDSQGNAYVTGQTASTASSFPVSGGPDLDYNGGSADAFVAKLSADGTTLLYSGYVGGSSSDVGNDIVVDGAGEAYIVGTTGSTEATFPVTIGPDLSYNGSIEDVFVAKVNTSGTSLLYAGYVGGTDIDKGLGIALNTSGRAVLTGLTRSDETSFPVAVGPDLTHNGDTDVFVAQVSADGTQLEYAGYVGGSGAEHAWSVAVDGAGNAYLAGCTTSAEGDGFPVTAGPDLTFNGGQDAFLARVNSATAALDYAGYVGGSANECADSVAVSVDGVAFITGSTGSSDFPVTGAPDTSFNGAGDVFVSGVSADGEIVYGTFLGGNGGDGAQGIVVDDDGDLYLAGITSSMEATFPVTAGPDLSSNGSFDAFVAKILMNPPPPAVGGGGGGGSPSPLTLLTLGLFGALGRRLQK